MNVFRSFAGTTAHKQARYDQQRQTDIDLAHAMIKLHRDAIAAAKAQLIPEGDPAYVDALRQRMSVLVGLCRGPHGDAVMPLVIDAFPEAFPTQGTT